MSYRVYRLLEDQTLVKVHCVTFYWVKKEILLLILLEPHVIQLTQDYSAYGMDFTLVDTAGVRKKGKTMDNVEFYSVMRSIKAIESSDVVLLIIDATIGLESQDVNLFSLGSQERKRDCHFG